MDTWPLMKGTVGRMTKWIACGLLWNTKITSAISAKFPCVWQHWVLLQVIRPDFITVGNLRCFKVTSVFYLISITVFRRGQIRNKGRQFVSCTVVKALWHHQPYCPWTAQQRRFLCETPSNMFRCETFQCRVYFVRCVYRRYKRKLDFSTSQCLSCAKYVTNIAYFWKCCSIYMWFNVLVWI